MIIVETISNKKDDAGNVLLKVEIYGKDIAEDVLYSLPGFESVPLEKDKVLFQNVDGGDSVVFLVPMKSDIKPGERRIYATDGNGIVKIELFMNEKGQVAIKTPVADLIKLISESMTVLKTVTETLLSATVATALGPQTLDPGTLTTLGVEFGKITATLAKYNLFMED